MSITSYVSNFRGLLFELKQSLSEEDIDELRGSVSSLQDSDWTQFVRSNQGLIDAYLTASPSQRQKLKKFQKPHLKKFLVLAAAQKMKAALIFSEKMVAESFVGLSYRKASVVAADHYFDMFFAYPGFYWPFDQNPPKGFRIDKEEFYY